MNVHWKYYLSSKCHNSASAVFSAWWVVFLMSSSRSCSSLPFSALLCLRYGFVLQIRYAFELLTNPFWKRDYDIFSIDEQIVSKWFLGSDFVFQFLLYFLHVWFIIHEIMFSNNISCYLFVGCFWKCEKEIFCC